MAVEGQKYLTPVGVKGVRRNPAPKNPYKVVSSAEQPRSGEERPKHVTSRDGKAAPHGAEDSEVAGRQASMEQAGDPGSLESQKADDKSVA